MGIFDIFSNSDAQNAAQAQIQGYQQGYGALSGAYGNAGNALNQNYGQASNLLNYYFPQAASAVQSSMAPAQANFNNAQQGTTALGNALGLNGAAGNAAAVAAFQNNPGYQFQVQQATDAVNRNQAAQGMLASGNTNVDLSNYITGLAGTSWNNYLNQLQPYLGAANNAAGQVLQGGQTLGNIYTGQGNAQSGLFQGLGNAVSGLYQGQGNAAYGSQVGQGNAQAQADYANLQQSANLWNMFGNAVGGGAKLLGGNPNFLSNLSSNFGMS